MLVIHRCQNHAKVMLVEIHLVPLQLALWSVLWSAVGAVICSLAFGAVICYAVAVCSLVLWSATPLQFAVWRCDLLLLIHRCSDTARYKWWAQFCDFPCDTWVFCDFPSRESFVVTWYLRGCLSTKDRKFSIHHHMGHFGWSFQD
jgi:hypothetical protein